MTKSFARTMLAAAAAFAGLLGLNAQADAAHTLAFSTMNFAPPAGLNGTTGTGTGSPNFGSTWLGTAINLAVPAGSTAITGFDLTSVNFAGLIQTPPPLIEGEPGLPIVVRIDVVAWNGFNTGTISSTNPFFNSLAGVRTFFVNFPSPYNPNTFFTLQDFTSPGVVPFFDISANPIFVTDSTVGIALRYAFSVDGGTTFSLANGFNNLIRTGVAPEVGSNLAGGQSGWLRNANSENTGNFNTGLRTFGGGLQFQNVALRVYVPEPTTLALLAPVGLLLARRRA
jgi:hypothetical protein